MELQYHPAASRGHANHGWLDTWHTFSFANYYDPKRIHFGMLRVLNDDWIAGGEGFGLHPHDNMEIITIPLEGEVEHQDSMGNKTRLKTGEIQVMSAGSGIFHSEYNPNPDQSLRLLQIWIFPEKKNVEPRYSQVSIAEQAKPETLYQLVSPYPDSEGAWIGQKAWFHMGELSAGWKGSYQLKNPQNGVYAFLIEGKALVAGKELSRRDGLAVRQTESIDIVATEPSRLLLMEVPLS